MHTTPKDPAGNLTSIRAIPASHPGPLYFSVLCWSIRWIYLGPCRPERCTNCAAAHKTGFLMCSGVPAFPRATCLDAS